MPRYATLVSGFRLLLLATFATLSGMFAVATFGVIFEDWYDFVDSKVLMLLVPGAVVFGQLAVTFRTLCRGLRGSGQHSE